MQCILGLTRRVEAAAEKSVMRYLHPESKSHVRINELEIEAEMRLVTTDRKRVKVIKKWCFSSRASKPAICVVHV